MKHFSIQISSRRLLSEFLDQQGVVAEKKNPIYAALDKRAKIGAEEFKIMLLKEGLTEEAIASIETFFQCKSLEELKKYISGPGLGPVLGADQGSSPSPSPEKNAFSELEKLFSMMGSLGYGDFLQLDLSVVRGLAYYTGIVFEVYDRAKTLRAIAGGGRYDNLLANLGGHSLTGVGFGMGDVVLGDLLAERGLLPKGRAPIDYYLLDVAPSGDGLPKVELLSLAMELRAEGKRIGYSLQADKFKKQMNAANDLSAKKVLFFGSDKAGKDQYEIKDMVSGEQKILSREAL